jgi:hypothetical protein
MQDERLIRPSLDQPSQVGLLFGGVDVRIKVVLEDAEIAIESDIDTRRLNHPLVVWVEAHSASMEFGTEIAVG